MQLLPQQTASRLYVNGDMVAESGKTGKNEKTSIPFYDRKLIALNADTTRLEIIMQISNFHHINGGVQHNIRLGAYNKMYSSYIKWLVINVLLLGAIFIMALYHIGLYFIRRKSISALYFALVCILIFIRLAVASNHFESFFFNFNWSFVLFLEVTSIIVVPLVFLLYVDTIFNRILPTWSWYIIYAVTTAFVLMFVFTSPRFYLQTVGFMQYWIVLIALLVIVLLIIATFRKVQYTGIFAIGYFVFILTILNDIFAYNSFIETRFMVHFGLFVFLFSQSFLLSKSFSAAFNQSEKLTKELININANLETIIAERTNEISQQKTKIEVHANVLQKSLIKLRKLENFKEGLMSMIIHDLKNPLNQILNLSDSYTENEKTAIVKKSGLQMQNLVANLLDLNKYENTKMKINESSFSLTALVNQTINDVQYQCLDKNIEIETNIPENTTVIADKEIIQRVLINLLLNAIKFSPNNSIIQIFAENTENRHLKISVKDNGIGIPKNQQKEIFKRFRQVNNKKDKNFKSFGIGLAFCKMAVEAHRSKIELNSETGKGATFSFYLTKGDTKQNEAKTSHIKIQNQIPQLTDTEKEILQPNILQLKNVEIYKILQIRKIIKNIPDNSPEVVAWKKTLLKAANTQNTEFFNELLQIK